MFLPLFTLAMSLMALVVWLRLVLPLPVGGRAKSLLGLALLLAANRVTLLRQLDVTGPDALLLATAWLHGAVILLFLLVLVVDLAGLLSRRLRMTPVRRAVVLGAAGLVLGAVGVQQAVRVPPVREVPLAVRYLPKGLEGLRVTVLADMHIGPLFREPWVRQVVERTLAARPDLILLPGDVLDAPARSLARDMAPLALLKAPLGVFVSPGNHEVIHGVDRSLRALEGLGLTVLSNAHRLVEARGERLAVLGLADRSGPARRGGDAPDLGKALNGTPDKDAHLLRLLLAHQPRDAAEAAAAGVDVQVSGHTHGGQVLPFRPLSARVNGYVGGGYRVGDMALYVANGVGLWAGIPLRLGVPSEIVVLRLTRDVQAADG